MLENTLQISVVTFKGDSKMARLFRVFTATEGDTSITERLVCADDDAGARVAAIANVKSQNPTKGDTKPKTSKENTTILSVKECGKHGVLVINRIPLSSLSAIHDALTHSATPTLSDHLADILRLADLPEGSTLEEAIQIIEAKLDES